MTYRERRERKAERLREWGGKRDGKADAAQRGVHAIADGIPLGQPILVGHHSERRARRDQERIHSGMAATIEHGHKADEFRSRAANIEAAADHAIYSDDPDAIERLEEKIAGLEANRDRIKAINKAARAGKLGEIELTEGEKRDLMNIARHSYHDASKGYPSYALTNLGGNINRCKQRLAALRDPKPALPRVILLRYAGECSKCGKHLERGTSAHYSKVESTIWCYPECEAA